MPSSSLSLSLSLYAMQRRRKACLRVSHIAARHRLRLRLCHSHSLGSEAPQQIIARITRTLDPSTIFICLPVSPRLVSFHRVSLSFVIGPCVYYSSPLFSPHRSLSSLRVLSLVLGSSVYHVRFWSLFSRVRSTLLQRNTLHCILHTHCILLWFLRSLHGPSLPFHSNRLQSTRLVFWAHPSLPIHVLISSYLIRSSSVYPLISSYLDSSHSSCTCHCTFMLHITVFLPFFLSSLLPSPPFSSLLSSIASFHLCAQFFIGSYSTRYTPHPVPTHLYHHRTPNQHHTRPRRPLDARARHMRCTYACASHHINQNTPSVYPSIYPSRTCTPP